MNLGFKKIKVLLWTVSSSHNYYYHSKRNRGKLYSGVEAKSARKQKLPNNGLLSQKAVSFHEVKMAKGQLIRSD